METYWHRLCQNLPPALAAEGRSLAKGTGLRPSVNRYHKLWELLKPLGKQAEGLALLNEGIRLWPRATSLKLELAQLYLAHGDGQRVTTLLSLAEAQKDPACGWVAVKGALLCGKVEWVRLLSGSLAIAKLDKSATERECLEFCRLEQWQEAAGRVRVHHGLPEPQNGRQLSPPAQPMNRPMPIGEAQKSVAEQQAFASFHGCFNVDVPMLRDWLSSPAVVEPHGPWQTVVDQLTSAVGEGPLLPLAEAELPRSLRQKAAPLLEPEAKAHAKPKPEAKAAEQFSPQEQGAVTRLALVADLLKAATKPREERPSKS